MRCKKHLSDPSSSIGVCASCLRDRLFLLIHSQTHSDLGHPDKEPKDNHHPPLVFPRSVSPYISRRKSDPIPRFYSTPQVNPRNTHNSITTSSSSIKKNKFGLISKLFRSRSAKPDPDPTTSTSYVHYTNNPRGMSPERREENPKELFEPSPARGYHRKASPARVLPSPARSGMAFCLSPLVRPSPSRHWKDTGEIRGPAVGATHCVIKPHLSAAASFCANRSRKIADFGRLNRNR